MIGEEWNISVNYFASHGVKFIDENAAIMLLSSYFDIFSFFKLYFFPYYNNAVQDQIA